MNKSGLLGRIGDPTDEDQSRIVASSSNFDSPAGLDSSISDIQSEDHPVTDGENPENQSENERTQLSYTPATTSTVEIGSESWKSPS